MHDYCRGLMLVFASVFITACATDSAPSRVTPSNDPALRISHNYIVGQVWVDVNAPTVLIAHGCTGVTRHEHEWANQIASWGFNAVIVDSLHGRGIRQAICDNNRLYPYARLKEIYEIAALISARSDAPIGIVGFSHGGALVLHVAIDENNKYIKAGVAYYPNCSAWARADERAEPRHPTLPAAWPNFFHATIPVALMYAGEDDWTPYVACDDVVQGDIFERHLFPHATHGFDMKGPNRRLYGYYLRYDEKADVESRKLTRAFFERNLASISATD